VVPPQQDDEPTGKSSPRIVLAAGVALILAGLGGIGWYFFRSRPIEVDVPPPVNASPEPEPAETAPASSARPLRTPRRAPAPPPASPTQDPQRSQIASLQSLAREAYAKGNYAAPPETSAIGYSKQVLALDPKDDYSKKLLENGVSGARYQVQQALAHKNFAEAERVARALARLLPGRRDIVGLKDDIAAARRAAQPASHPRATATAPTVRLYHMHTDKSPADNGAYCLGVLSASAERLKFTAQSASDGKLHNLEFACSEIREIKKNARVASHQGGFHLRTASANFNFVPENGSTAIASTLASACGI
jgi:hypothetical protein